MPHEVIQIVYAGDLYKFHTTDDAIHVELYPSCRTLRPLSVDFHTLELELRNKYEHRFILNLAVATKTVQPRPSSRQSCTSAEQVSLDGGGI